MDWYTLVGSKYAGSESLAQQAWDSGEIKYTEQAHKYYCGSHTLSTIETKGTTVEGKSDFGEVNPNDCMLLMNGLSDDMHHEDEGTDWLDYSAKPVPEKLAVKVCIACGHGGDAGPDLCSCMCMC